MLRGFKKPQILLDLIISAFVPILSGYFLYCDLADHDLFSADAEYENADMDDFFLASNFQKQNFQNQLKFLGSIGSSTLLSAFLPETNAIEQATPLSSLLSCLGQETFILRC